MLVKIMLTAWIFFALSMMVGKFQKDTAGEVGELTAWFCVVCFGVSLLAGVAILIGMIWL
jgi:hypothetical protein